MTEAPVQSKAITPYEKFRLYARSDAVREHFAEVVGNHNAAAYISSVIIAVGSNDSLMQCDTRSIITSAMRAATLRLSCDPGIGQAYLVPFKGKATLVVGYKGLKDMAIRTGHYRYLNVARVYEGQSVTEDQLRGTHKIAGSRTSQTIIGYMMYFELVNGFSKTFYMTVDEILDHAATYSKSFDNPKSIWKTNQDAMMAKTVLRLGLSRWGYLDPNDSMVMNAVDENMDTEMVDGEFVEQPESHTEAQNLSDLGYDTPAQPEPPITADPTTGEVIENQPTEPTAPPAMTLSEASKITNSTGKTMLIDISTSQLGFMRDSLEKKQRTPAQETELTAILTIIKARLDGQQAAATQDRLI
jgi:recombination protein RecT